MHAHAHVHAHVHVMCMHMHMHMHMFMHMLCNMCMKVHKKEIPSTTHHTHTRDCSPQWRVPRATEGEGREG